MNLEPYQDALRYALQSRPTGYIVIISLQPVASSLFPHTRFVQRDTPPNIDSELLSQTAVVLFVHPFDQEQRDTFAQTLADHKKSVRVLAWPEEFAGLEPALQYALKKCPVPIGMKPFVEPTVRTPQPKPELKKNVVFPLGTPVGAKRNAKNGTLSGALQQYIADNEKAHALVAKEDIRRLYDERPDHLKQVTLDSMASTYYKLRRLGLIGNA